MPPIAKGTKKKAALAPNYCEIPGCEYFRIVQRHRIIPGRDGGKYKLGNVIALCPNHHGEADRGWWEVEYLLEIVRIRIDGEQENRNQGTTEGSREPTQSGGSPSEESLPSSNSS